MGPSDLDGVMAIEEGSFPTPWSRGMFLEDFPRDFSDTLFAVGGGGEVRGDREGVSRGQGGGGCRQPRPGGTKERCHRVAPGSSTGRSITTRGAASSTGWRGRSPTGSTSSP